MGSMQLAKSWLILFTLPLLLSRLMYCRCLEVEGAHCEEGV